MTFRMWIYKNFFPTIILTYYYFNAFCVLFLSISSSLTTTHQTKGYFHRACALRLPVVVIIQFGKHVWQPTCLKLTAFWAHFLVKWMCKQATNWTIFLYMLFSYFVQQEKRREGKLPNTRLKITLLILNNRMNSFSASVIWKFIWESQ